jgi:GPH family glycoside/pentoside/hexuronide:cation symporter
MTIDAFLPKSKSVAIPYALFGAAVAFAGPPIYIHAPNLYADTHGMPLALLGAVLLGLRLLDFIQDPLLAWWIARSGMRKQRLVAMFSCLLAAGALMLFAPQLPIAPAWWFGLSLALVFTGFSALQILYYSSGTILSARMPGGHREIAGWRETGVLAGVSAACVAPALIASVTGNEQPFALYALALCALLAFAVARMTPYWPERQSTNQPMANNSSLRDFRALFRDQEIRRLLLIALINALPSGLTATLFVFFVKHRLQAEVHTGPALLVFFLAAAAAVPLWASLAQRIGSKKTMLTGMVVAVTAFLWVLTLGSGDWLAFYLIAAVSGACLGADMTLLPAMLASRLTSQKLAAEQAFGLWGFVNKASLALAAGCALPFLDAAGFDPSATTNDDSALFALAIAYAAVPCFLKMLAAIVLAITPISEGEA